jgi:hypothetical protein
VPINPNEGFSGLIETVETSSCRIGIKLAARTMAGPQINEAVAPTKMLLRVSSRPSELGITAL